jgi:hypothetical protein
MAIQTNGAIQFFFFGHTFGLKISCKFDGEEGRGSGDSGGVAIRPSTHPPHELASDV